MGNRNRRKEQFYTGGKIGDMQSEKDRRKQHILTYIKSVCTELKEEEYVYCNEIQGN